MNRLFPSSRPSKARAGTASRKGLVLMTVPDLRCSALRRIASGMTACLR
jgi:hypothetical protein